MEVTEILEILKGQVSASLDGVMVLRVMVERHVVPLKWRAHLLCDYVGAKDPTRKAMEELEDNVTVEWMAGLVSIGVMVSIECTITAFSASHCPDLVSRPSLHLFSPCSWLAR